MASPSIPRELEVARAAARAAGVVLRRHFAGSRQAQTKADGSPVTQADTEADAAILEILRSSFPDDAILSEESVDDGRRLGRERVWLVDPLDGTREFVAGIDEFAVHIALAHSCRPVVSVVYQPLADRLWEAVAGAGAYLLESGQRRRLAVSARSDPTGLRLGVSRTLIRPRLRRLLEETPAIGHTAPMGASIKHMAVAAGELDGVLGLSEEEKEWDSAAPGLIVEEAGGVVTDVDGHPLQYNRADVRHLRGSVMSSRESHPTLRALAARYWPAHDVDRSD